jgi:hypothetical protein
MLKAVEKIDLHLPISWGRMSVQELETVAKAMIDLEAENRLKPKPLADKELRIRLFMQFTGLEILEPANPVIPVEEQFYVVRRKGINEQLNLYLWQIEYWIEHYMSWLDKKPTVIHFPYEKYTHLSWRGYHRYEGPATFMQNFKWQQYRIANDYYILFVKESNRLYELSSDDTISATDLKKQQKLVRVAKALFLATLFNRRIKYVDTETKLVKKEYMYASWQSIDNKYDFLNFDDVKFQVILFWWSSELNRLAKTYPKVFKEEDTKKRKFVDPLTLYTRQTSIMEKYLRFSEEKLNRETYSNVLQHFQNMIDESDRMKEISNKK